jgi:hypothetical protein
MSNSGSNVTQLSRGKSKPLGAIVVIGSTLLACGGAQLVLESPIRDRCQSAGLQGCDELTAGVLLYVEGKEAEGMQKVEAGIQKNMSAPKELAQFVDAMDTLKQVPGAGQYVATLEPVLSIIRRTVERSQDLENAEDGEDRMASKQDDSLPRRGDSRAGSSERRRPRSGPERPFAGVIRATPENTDSCSFLDERTPAEDFKCVVVLTSLEVLTDVHVSPACSHDVFILAGDPQNPYWFLHGPAEHGLNVHGANYPVRSTDALVALILRKKPESPWDDLGCAVTWAGTPRTRNR